MTALLLALLLTANVQDADARALLQLEDDWATALVQRDRVVFERLLADACDRLLLSMRARRRMQSVAATVAALDGRPIVGEDDVAEALAYRVEPW